MSKKTLTEQLDSILPQTQCQACGYKDCLAYASAVAKSKAETNLCQPGGPETHEAIEALKPMNSPRPNAAPKKKIAFIQDDYCVGCLKCMNACPVDAIYGSKGQLHTVITDMCTGCGLCIAPCPTDCIDLLPITDHTIDISPSSNKQRYLNKQTRLSEQKQAKKTQHQLAKLSRKSYSKTQQARLDYILNTCDDIS